MGETRKMMTYEDLALEKLKKIQPSTVKEWAKAMGYQGASQFYHIFNRIRKDGKIIRVGRKKPFRYVMKG